MPREVGSKALRIPDGLSGLLRDLIHERTGLFFEDGNTGLMLEKLEPLAQSRGCSSFLEYYYALKENARDEWERAWDALSVQETYFWREMPQVKALTEKIVPEWFRNSSLTFRVWSAGCATGEEPYTLAIALAEAGWGQYPVEILGSDASQAALAIAERGIYRQKSFRTLPGYLRQKYFEPVAEGWKLSPEIRGRVKLRRANLLDPAEIAPLARVQVMFCRNVFIYFSRHAIRQAVATLAMKMSPGSWLFVGASESLLKMTTDFELKELGGALGYLRI